MFNSNTPTAPATPAPMQVQDQADLIVENANLCQENIELHELIGVQRAEIDRLQRELRRQKLGTMRAADACKLLLAAFNV